MNVEQYCQSIQAQYGSLQQLYVLQDAEGFQPSTAVQSMLFVDRVMLDWQSNSVEQKGEKNTEQSKAKVESYKVLDGLRQFAPEHVLLIGKPGSGKTTALQKLLLEEVSPTQPLTLLIELRGFQTSVFDIAYKFTETHQLNLSLESLKQQLLQGDCLLLIDGLNELPSKAAQSDLSAFLKTYKACRIVATTRDIELGGDFGIGKKLELEPLMPRQVETFINAYLPDEAQAAAMQRQLQPRLKDFQETPLLLLMLCSVFKKYNRIPDNLGLAFREFSQLYDERFKQGVEKLSYCRDLLSYLAFKMLQGKERLVPLLEVGEEEAIRWLSELTQVEDSYGWAQDWLRFLLKYHLLRKRGDKRIEFCHQLWQEYYAAEYLIRYLPQLPKEQIKANFLNLLKWTEVLKLMQGLSSSQTQVLRIAKLGLETDLLLGAMLSGAVQKHLAPECIEQLKVYPFPIRWRYIGWRFWMIHQAKPMLLLLLLQKAASSQASEEAASTLLNSSDRNVRDRAISALGKIGDASVLGVLRAALKDEDRIVRRSAAEALGKIGDASVLDALIAALKDEDSWVRSGAVSALGKIGDASVLDALIAALKDEDSWVRSRAVSVIGRIGGVSSLDVLIAALKDKDEFGEVCRSATFEFIRIGAASTDALIVALKDEDSGVRSHAVFALGAIRDVSALDALIVALKDEDSSVRRSAAEALGRIRDVSALDALIVALKDEDSSVRRSAAEALGRIRDVSVLDALIVALKDEDSSVRRSAAEALGAIKDMSVLDVLRAALKDEDSWVRSGAAKALGKIGDVSAFGVLIAALKDERSWVRSDAAKALGEIGDASALDALIAALKDEDSSVRSDAAEALGKIGDVSALDALIAALKDESSWVRSDAVKALGEIGDASTISILWETQLQSRCLYSGDDFMSTDDYTSTIEAIQNKCQFYNLALCQKESLTLPSGPVFQIPSVNSLQLQTTISGEIGAVNINSIANGPAIGTQINRSIPPSET